ncbi:MAG: AmmeMemoRadiSam system protein B, partial [archaeon]
KLREQVRSCFTNERGPGDLPLKRSDKPIKGIIVPHAGYEFSGPCAAWAYKELAESKVSSTFVIIAPDHNGLHEFPTTTTEELKTPLGVVLVDKSFVTNLQKKCSFLRVDKISEHAIEVQLPFLQVTQADVKDLRVVPIVVPSMDYYRELAEAIFEIDSEAVIICSTDLTHFGPQFDFVPFKYKVEENLKELDMGAINFLEKLDTDGFVKYVRRTCATVCGANAVIVALEAMKLSLADTGELLSYYTSSEVTGDWVNSVSYCSMRFE